MARPAALDSPFWLADASEREGRTPPDLPARVDVAIVGAGLVGCVLGLLLARAGSAVAVLDARAPGHGATGRSAGFLIRGTADHPDRVASEIGKDRALSLWRFSAASIADLVALLAEERVDCALDQSGSLVLAMDEDERRSLERSRALVAAEGDVGEVWTGAEVESRTGLLHFAAGWFRPGDGMVDPARLCRGLAAAAERRGARVLWPVRVQRVDERGAHRPVIVHTDRGEVAADRCVLAVNAALPTLDARLAPWVYPVRAQMLATAPAPPGKRLPWPVYAHHGYEYWRHQPSGELLFGGCRWAAQPDLECGVTDDTCVAETVFEAQRAFLARHLPAFATLPIRMRWTGIMAFTADRLPLVGELPGSSRQFVCGGWNGHGLALGPRSARTVAQRLLGEAPDEPLDFSPSRFARA